MTIEEEEKIFRFEKVKEYLRYTRECDNITWFIHKGKDLKYPGITKTNIYRMNINYIVWIIFICPMEKILERWYTT